MEPSDLLWSMDLKTDIDSALGSLVGHVMRSVGLSQQKAPTEQ